MWHVFIFQSTSVYLNCNSIVSNQKSTKLKVFKQKNVTVDFQVQTFEISKESMAKI